MPYLHLQTNQAVTPETKIAFLSAAAKELSAELGKPENVFMAAIDDKVTMLFAGTDEPCAMLEFAGLGLPEELTGLTRLICDLAQTHLGIGGGRVYVRFFDTERSKWGWNGKTFG